MEDEKVKNEVEKVTKKFSQKLDLALISLGNMLTRKSLLRIEVIPLAQ